MRAKALMIAMLLSVGLKAQSPPILASSPTTYSILRHEKQMMNQLGAWGLFSMGLGIVQLSENEGTGFDMGVQNLSWGAVDFTISVLSSHRLARLGSSLNTPQEHRKLRKALAWNLALDALYVGTGLALANSSRTDLQGHGRGILLQGGFLLVFDGFHYLKLGRHRPALERF